MHQEYSLAQPNIHQRSFLPMEYSLFVLAHRSQDRSWHIMICEAYVSVLPHALELDTARSETMVTVWPIDSDVNADSLNRRLDPSVCDAAINHYGLVISLRALKDAERAGANISDIGPFLLAWSPPMDKGSDHALVLVSNLSDVTTYKQAQEILLAWSRDIEQDPQLWQNGWDVNKLRLTVQLWVDEYGPKILGLFGAKE